MNTYFHQQLRRIGFDKFDWYILARGHKECMHLLEKVCIKNLNTLKPDGYNSMNEGYDTTADEDELKFIEQMRESIGNWSNDYYDLYDLLKKRMISENTFD